MDLFGCEAPPPKLKRAKAPAQGKYRLFFALLPCNEALEQILQVGTGLKSQFGLTGKFHVRDKLHLTLDHLGDFAEKPAEFVMLACGAAAEVAAQTDHFPVVLDHVLSFGKNAKKAPPLVLAGSREGNPELRHFRARLSDALAAVKVPGGGSFTPHVTLLYDPQLVPKQATAAISWSAGELVLVHSAMQGTPYEFLGRWPFRS